MSLRKNFVRPWPGAYLDARPLEAMEVETLVRTATLDGGYSLIGKSSRGPFTTIVHVPGGPLDGYRGTGPTVLASVQAALFAAEQAA